MSKLDLVHHEYLAGQKAGTNKFSHHRGGQAAGYLNAEGLAPKVSDRANRTSYEDASQC